MNWWLSFASEHAFLAVVIVDGCDTLAEAHQAVTRAGVNPGGEVAGFSFETDDPRFTDLDRKLFATLPRLAVLSRDQLMAIGVAGLTVAEARATGRYDVDAAEAALEKICDDCNPRRML